MLSGLRVTAFWNAVNAALDEPLCPCGTYTVWLKKLGNSVSKFGDAHPRWSVMHVVETMGPGLFSSPTPPWVDEDWEHLERVMAIIVTPNVRYLQEIGYLGSTSTAKAFPARFRRKG